jgi:hypothetical protein
MWKKKMYRWCWCENLMERDHLENPGVEQRMQLKWVSSKWKGMCALVSFGTG